MLGDHNDMRVLDHLFKGDRINDHHLSLAEKKNARESTEEIL